MKLNKVLSLRYSKFLKKFTLIEARPKYRVSELFICSEKEKINLIKVGLKAFEKKLSRLVRNAKTKGAFRLGKTKK